MRHRFYTDGSYDKDADVGGWSIVIVDYNNVKVKSGIKKDTTNNQMELIAVLNALEYAVRKHLKDIEILTDSMYVLNGVKKYIEIWKKNNWIGLSGKQIEYRQQWEGILIMLNSLEKNNFSVKFSKIKGHGGNPLNDLADSEAKKIIKAYKEM